MQDTAASENLPLLFTPMNLRSVTVRNRIVASPMCQYRSEDGSPNDWQLAHLGRLAIGGCGIVFGEETGVEARGRKTYTCAGIYKDGHIAEYRRLTDFLKANGAVPAIQLGHAGRKASCHDAIKDWAPLQPEDAADGFEPWVALGPSALPQTPAHPVPKAMDETDIADVIQAFVDATRRSLEAGYDILEIHGAHGYLIHQFLSPLTNKRNDGYGGSLENRMRFPLEITRAVRAAWPDDKPLFYRLSAIDGPGGMWGIEDSIALSIALKDCGVDIVDCSAGGIIGSASKAALPRLPGFNVPFAERIKKEAGVATMAVGLITEGRQAERILQNGQADLVALARELMWYADWPAHAARELGIDDHRFMPEGYAHRLQLRDRQAAMAINQRTPENYAVLSELAGIQVEPECSDS
jgi:2,4-dienoyl-CoA reductase-like NADH-dependent reductase (Old Yellow Enzyme family)